jgi:hypothetical protein
VRQCDELLRRRRVCHCAGVSWDCIDRAVGRPGLDDRAGRDACWAVGHSEASPQTRAAALIEHWNGAKWTLVDAPSPEGTSLSSAGTASIGRLRQSPATSGAIESA